MFLERSILTISELVGRWAEHSATHEAVFDLCRNRRLEIVFPADGRRFWAYAYVNSKLTMIGEALITGYICLGRESVGKYLTGVSEVNINDWPWCYAPDNTETVHELFEVVGWTKPRLDAAQKAKFCTKISSQAKPDSWKNVFFRAAPVTMIMLPGMDTLMPFSRLTPEDAELYADLMNRGGDHLFAFDFKQNGLFTLEQARITIRSIQDYEQQRSASTKNEVSDKVSTSTENPGQDKETEPVISTKVELIEAGGTDNTLPKWCEITIALYVNNRIGFSQLDGQGLSGDKAIHDIGLINKKNQKLNKAGNALFCLLRKKFPTGNRATKPDSQTMKRLRTALHELTGIKGNPFYSFNSADGWKPKFKLIDRRDAANERAKERALFCDYNDVRDYDNERDAADNFLKKNDPNYRE
ncbi:MAG: hypothetical protein V3T17_06225 [Pseudomonadales bacterium]